MLRKQADTKKTCTLQLQSAAGSDGKLGNLEPESADAFQANILIKPFKLTENYFTCAADQSTAFSGSLGIAHGNAALFLALVMAVIFALASCLGCMKPSIVNDYDVEKNGKLLTEALYLSATDQHESFSHKHIDLQAAFRSFLQWT